MSIHEMDVKITEIKNHPFYRIIELIKLQSYNRRELIIPKGGKM